MGLLWGPGRRLGGLGCPSVTTKKKETTLQTQIQAAIKERGGYSVKTHGGAFGSDTIDLIVCYRGRFVGLEAKILGNDATPRQARRLRQIADAGGKAGVVFSVSDALRVLDEIEREGEEWKLWKKERSERVVTMRRRLTAGDPSD